MEIMVYPCILVTRTYFVLQFFWLNLPLISCVNIFGKKILFFFSKFFFQKWLSWTTFTTLLRNFLEVKLQAVSELGQTKLKFKFNQF